LVSNFLSSLSLWGLRLFLYIYKNTKNKKYKK
jgi:hypothetical protein